jgi:hypothetical protein
VGIFVRRREGELLVVRSLRAGGRMSRWLGGWAGAEMTLAPPGGRW